MFIYKPAKNTAAPKAATTCFLAVGGAVLNAAWPLDVTDEAIYGVVVAGKSLTASGSSVPFTISKILSGPGFYFKRATPIKLLSQSTAIERRHRRAVPSTPT